MSENDEIILVGDYRKFYERMEIMVDPYTRRTRMVNKYLILSCFLIYFIQVRVEIQYCIAGEEEGRNRTTVTIMDDEFGIESFVTYE